MTVTKHLVISGRVQGVGYRFYMQRQARELGVAGWVRNRGDSTVEAVVHGSPGQVNAIVAWARHGPPSAVVAEVKISDGSGEYAGFETRQTE